MLTVFFGALFVASAFIFNSNTAQMQTGANTIAFDRYDSESNRTKIYVMNADGTNEIELGEGFDPSWSSSGAKIVYAYGTSEQYDIWTMNADGSEKTQLTENYRSYAPAWSPDGSRVAFVSDHEGSNHVYVINADGTNQQRISVTASEVVQEYAPAWSPDGSQIIFLAQKVVGGLGRNDYYAATGGGLGATTQLTYLDALLDIVPAAVSPDGSRLVFEYQHDLQAALLDGSNQMINLTNNGNSTDEEPDYAPGGSKIIFSRAGTLAVMNADGSNIESLGIEGNYADWNPTAIIETPTPTPTPTVTPTPAITADISVQANASASNVNVGQNVTYTVSITNGGANAATGVLLNNAFPSSLTLVSLGSSQGSCAVANNQINCQLGSLDVNASATVTIVASPNTAGSISNQFSVSASENDPIPSNNSATVTITAVGNCAQPLAQSVQVVSQRWIRLGIIDRDLLTMVVRNTSGRDLDPRLIGVFDNLPSDITIDALTRRGYTQCAAPLGSPYVVGSVGRSSVWRPGQTITLQILFRNPQRRNPISFTNRFFSGNVNP